MDRIIGYMLFQFVEADDEGGKDKQHRCPNDGNYQGKGQVVGGEATGSSFIFHADGLSYADLRAYLI